jgi:hypothetical protein
MPEIFLANACAPTFSDLFQYSQSPSPVSEGSGNGWQSRFGNDYMHVRYAHFLKGEGINKYGYMMEFQPLSFLYQLLQPPKTVFPISRWIWAVHLRAAEAFGSTVVTSPRKIGVMSFDIYPIVASMPWITEECPTNVFGPTVMKKLGKPSSAVPM